VVGTPIGNLGDITFRALESLKAADAIACEDTRRTAKLLSHFEIPRPRTYFACNDVNERRVVSRVLGLLREGLTVALCSDAGMPMVSDPGFVVVREARAEGYEVEVIPGVSAVPTAVVVSGLAVHSWLYKGFPPRKPGKRRRFFTDEADSPHTLVFFESPQRLGSTLAVAAEALGERQAAVCVELTKKFEQVERGTLAELAALFEKKGPRGEVTVVVSGADA
jgi:16S rRNA (cytidine1402-2'-O)-methyltransferase